VSFVIRELDETAAVSIHYVNVVVASAFRNEGDAAGRRLEAAGCGDQTDDYQDCQGDGAGFHDAEYTLIQHLTISDKLWGQNQGDPEKEESDII